MSEVRRVYYRVTWSVLGTRSSSDISDLTKAQDWVAQLRLEGTNDVIRMFKVTEDITEVDLP